MPSYTPNPIERIFPHFYRACPGTSHFGGEPTGSIEYTPSAGQLKFQKLPIYGDKSDAVGWSPVLPPFSIAHWSLAPSICLRLLMHVYRCITLWSRSSCFTSLMFFNPSSAFSTLSCATSALSSALSTSDARWHPTASAVTAMTIHSGVFIVSLPFNDQLQQRSLSSHASGFCSAITTWLSKIDRIDSYMMPSLDCSGSEGAPSVHTCGTERIAHWASGYMRHYPSAPLTKPEMRVYQQKKQLNLISDQL